jgi:hypothetical protein
MEKKGNHFKCDFSGLKLTLVKLITTQNPHFVEQCINARQLLFIVLVLERKERLNNLASCGASSLLSFPISGPSVNLLDTLAEEWLRPLAYNMLLWLDQTLPVIPSRCSYIDIPLDHHCTPSSSHNKQSH